MLEDLVQCKGPVLALGSLLWEYFRISSDHSTSRILPELASRSTALPFLFKSESVKSLSPVELHEVRSDDEFCWNNLECHPQRRICYEGTCEGSPRSVTILVRHRFPSWYRLV